MFGLSLPELFIIMAVALIVFGPDQLPELAKKMGKLSSQFRRTADSVKREFYNNLYPPAQEKPWQSIKRELKTVEDELRGTLSDPLATITKPTPPSESEKKGPE